MVLFFSAWKGYQLICHDLCVHALDQSLWAGDCGKKTALDFIKSQTSPRKKLPQCPTMCNMLGTSVLKSAENGQGNVGESMLHRESEVWLSNMRA